MLTLDDNALEALTKRGAKIVVKNVPASVAVPPSELAEILKTMVGILNRPVPSIPQTQLIPAPVVHVDSPTVSLSPSINVPPVPRRWRFVVTKRDNTAQQRIQEIVIEPLE